MTTKSEKSEAAIEAEVQTAVDKEQEKGYVGVKVDPLPNEAYSLESGPDSPGLLEAREAFVDAERAEAAQKK